MRHGAVVLRPGPRRLTRRTSAHWPRAGRRPTRRGPVGQVAFDGPDERPAAHGGDGSDRRPGGELEEWPDLRELRGERLSAIPADELEEEFVHAFRGASLSTRFLGGETIGSLFDRVLPALERLVADQSWDSALAVLHGGVNRAILSYALTADRMFLGHFEQAPGCVNIVDIGDEWPASAIVRAVNVAPLDLLHASTRLTTMEGYWRSPRLPGAQNALKEKGPAVAGPFDPVNAPASADDPR